MESFIIVAKTIAALLICFHEVHCHGRLKTPASRSSMWRYGFSNPTNYNDNQLFCGGKYRQFVVNRGQCGVCGDPYDGARENEALGRFANGVIAGTYNEGDVMPVTVEITANHLGWFEFRLCPVNNKNTKATPQCLDRYLLREASTGNSRILIGSASGDITTYMQLPTGLTCTQCVLQWKYHTGNSWGTDPGTGRGCLGCGNEQEEFYGCADVTIRSGGGDGGITLHTVSHTDNDDNNNNWNDDNNNNNNNNNNWNDDNNNNNNNNGPAGGLGVDGDVSPNGDVRVCRSAGAHRGQASIDSWCVTNCKLGYCPATHCECVTVNRPIPTTPTTTRSGGDWNNDNNNNNNNWNDNNNNNNNNNNWNDDNNNNNNNNWNDDNNNNNNNNGPAGGPGVDGDVSPNSDVSECRSAGAYRGQASIDSWCVTNCERGFCPATHCECVTVNRPIPKQAATPTPVRQSPTPYSKPSGNAGNLFVSQDHNPLDGIIFSDAYCQTTCMMGQCPSFCRSAEVGSIRLMACRARDPRMRLLPNFDNFCSSLCTINLCPPDCECL